MTTDLPDAFELILSQREVDHIKLGLDVFSDGRAALALAGIMRGADEGIIDSLADEGMEAEQLEEAIGQVMVVDKRKLRWLMLAAHQVIGLSSQRGNQKCYVHGHQLLNLLKRATGGVDLVLEETAELYKGDEND